VEVHALRRVGRVLEDAVLAATGSPSARLRGRDADDLYVTTGRQKPRPGYPARAGGPWLRKTLVPSGLRAVVVPSGLRVTVQPHWWIATWWWKKQ
jgi:hypothetical protein